MKGRYPASVIGLLLIGLVLTLIGRFAMPMGNLAGFVGIVGACIFVAGSCLLAKENGFHPFFGALGLIVLMGWWGVVLGVLLIGLPLMFSSPVPPDVVTRLEDEPPE